MTSAKHSGTPTSSPKDTRVNNSPSATMKQQFRTCLLWQSSTTKEWTVFKSFVRSDWSTSFSTVAEWASSVATSTQGLSFSSTKTSLKRFVRQRQHNEDRKSTTSKKTSCEFYMRLPTRCSSVSRSRAYTRGNYNPAWTYTTGRCYFRKFPARNHTTS